MDYVGILIIIFISGLFVGSKTMEKRWKTNAREPQRLCFGGVFYKVVALNDKKSHEYLNIHLP